MVGICKCGCGGETKPGNIYINGHQNIGRTRTKKGNICYKCGIILNADNWAPSRKKTLKRICNTCANIESKEYRIKHYTPTDNKESGTYLGVHIAEDVLSKVFKDVKRMPRNNPGYDFICNNGYLIDSKASATGDKHDYWLFSIKYNTIADYFLCIAFDNRIDFNIIHLWLIPGDVVNNLPHIKIDKSSLTEWDTYALPPDKVIECCNHIKNGAHKQTD